MRKNFHFYSSWLIGWIPASDKEYQEILLFGQTEIEICLKSVICKLLTLDNNVRRTQWEIQHQKRLVKHWFFAIRITCAGKSYFLAPRHNTVSSVSFYINRYTHTYTWPGIQSEDTIYTRVYSVFVSAFKARTNLCITHSKWGHFFTHLWTCLARTKRGLRPYPPYTHIMAEGGQCT